MSHCPRVIVADCPTIGAALVKAGRVASPTGTVKIWQAGTGYAVYPGDFDLRSKAKLIEIVRAEV